MNENEGMVEGEARMEELVVPPFVQIVTAVSNAFGRAAEDLVMSDVLYGLDAKGRVWEWSVGDPERKGSRDGWDLLPNVVYRDGEEPPVQKKTR
jgi:hypothetical protein